jgi:hypothetical protein
MTQLCKVPAAEHRPAARAPAAAPRRPLKSLIVVMTAVAFLPGFVGATDTAAAASHAADHTPKKRWKQPRTPWGDPDLQGMWPVAHLMTVPLQRPEKYGESLQFTPEELAEQRKAAEAQNKRYKDEESQHRLGMGHWVEDTDVPVQTSLIVDPPNGQLPAQTPQGKEASAKMGSDWNREVFDSVADFDAWDRCVTRGLPASMFPFPYNNGIQILQAPGYVVINLEMIHEARIVPLGKMPALDGAVKQWMGSPRGHWEGNVLVVETTNFNGQTSMTSFPTRGSPKDPRATSTEMKLVERFERTDDDRLTYTVTVTDPVTQVASWTARSPWRRDDSYQFYEYACHEDNEAIRNYIVTSRVRRAKEAAAKEAAAKEAAGKGAAADPATTKKAAAKGSAAPQAAAAKP